MTISLKDYQRLYGSSDDAAPGWDAIDARLKQAYGNQEPLHWGTVMKFMEGGPDPIDGISAYQCRDGGRDHLHFVTYGYSILYYEEEAVGQEYSGYGFEMTFRLASELPPPEQPVWVCGLLQNLARYVFNTNKVFDAGHWIPANGPIRASAKTDIVGLAFAVDPVLKSIDSPHGRIDFIQAFGITQSELDVLKSKKRSCEEILEEHLSRNPLLITDLARRNA